MRAVGILRFSYKLRMISNDALLVSGEKNLYGICLKRNMPYKRTCLEWDMPQMGHTYDGICLMGHA